MMYVGAARKWFLPNFPDQLFVSLIFFAVLLYVSIGFKIFLKSPCPRWFYFYFLAIFFWGVIGTIYSKVSNPMVLLCGLSNYFSFFPLCLAAAFVFRDNDQLIEFFKKMAYFTVPVLILGFLQYSSPADSLINKYVDSEKFVATMGGQYARVTGTFSYIAGYSIFLTFAFTITLGAVVMRANLKEVVLLGGFLVGVFLNALMTGSRTAVWWCIINLSLFLGVYCFLKLKSLIPTLFKLSLVFALGFYLLSQNPQVNQIYSAFSSRAHAFSEEITNRLDDNFTPFKFLNQAGLIGYGMGTTYPPSYRYIKNWHDMTQDFEEEPERVLLELGLVGYLLVYSWRFLIFIYCLSICFKLRRFREFGLVLSLTIYQVSFLQMNHLLFNATSSFLYWFAIGCVVLIRHNRLKAEFNK